MNQDNSRNSVLPRSKVFIKKACYKIIKDLCFSDLKVAVLVRISYCDPNLKTDCVILRLACV